MGLGAQFSASDWSPAHFSCFLGLEQFAIFLIIYSTSRSPGFAPVHILAWTGCVSLDRSLNFSVLTFSPGCDGVGQVTSELCLFQITLGFCLKWPEKELLEAEPQQR